MKKWISLIICAALMLACNRVERGEVILEKKDINSVMRAHTAEILAIPGVTGLAISELEDKTPCIWVMVLESSEELERKIPDTLEGHPVKVVVSGEIRPLGGE